MSSTDGVYDVYLCTMCLMSMHEWCQHGTCQCGCQDERLIPDPNRATISGPREDGEQ